MSLESHQDSIPPQEEKPSKYDRYLKISALLKRLGIQDSCKTLDCNHENGCLYNILNQTFKGVVLGYVGKTIINLVSTLLQFKKLIKNPFLLVKAIINADSLRFGLFPGVYNLVMQSSLCLMRRQGVNKHAQGFVSGFLAGFLALATRQKQNRNIWGVMLLARAVDCIYKSLCNSQAPITNNIRSMQSSVIQVVKIVTQYYKRKIIKKRPLDYSLMFSTMYLVFSIAYAQEPECLPHSFNKFLRAFSNEHPADLQLRRCWIEKSNLELIKKGIPPHNAEKGLLLDFVRKR